jgi:hypothetical protein
MIGVNLKNCDFQLAFDQSTYVNRLVMHNSFQIVFAHFYDLAYIRVDDDMTNVYMHGFSQTYQVKLKNSEQLFDLLNLLKSFSFIQVNNQTFVNINECFYVGLRNNKEVLFLKTMGYISFPDKFLIQNNFAILAPNTVRKSKHIQTRVIDNQYPYAPELRKEVRLKRQASFVNVQA